MVAPDTIGRPGCFPGDAKASLRRLRFASPSLTRPVAGGEPSPSRRERPPKPWRAWNVSSQTTGYAGRGITRVKLIPKLGGRDVVDGPVLTSGMPFGSALP